MLVPLKIVFKEETELNEFSKSNPKLSNLMQSLRNDLRHSPENYCNKNMSNVLEDMIQNEEYIIIHDFSKRWEVEEDELTYVVAKQAKRGKRTETNRKL